ncbi:MAG TPA: alpha/beta fold hydrolase, partial [Luteolibacter sp.]|nr:alpha/beta fold hydrolase [Luteolibacter sp.]
MRVIGFLLAAVFGAAVSQAAYDPMAVPETKVVSETREIRDAKRDRIIPVRVYLPEKKQVPVILFSHGLGGSRDNNAWLGEHWAKRGYFAVFLQHPGSDDAVWKEAQTGQRMVNMKSAASFENLKLRGEDVKAVIDELAVWNKEGEWKDRMDLQHIGISGHSFGAHTAQIVAGQEFAGGKISFRDPRVSAAIMMSPAPPALGDPAKSFESIRIPCLLLTGTLDESPIGKTTPADRLKVFPSLTNAAAWQVVFDKATHSSFGGRGNGGYHPDILA